MGTADRTTTSRSRVWNPCASTVMWYGFGGRLRKTNRPAASVVAVRVKPETGFAILTSTDCMTPPVGSLMVPCTVPAPPNSWARADAGVSATTSAHRADARAADITRFHRRITPLFEDNAER